MGLFDKIFNRKEVTTHATQVFQMLNGYTPIFTNWHGSLYESELVRAAVDARSRHMAKLDVTFQGSARGSLVAKLKKGPNDFQTWGQFLYRLNTLLDVDGNAFIVPVKNQYDETTGIYPIRPISYDLVQYKEEPFIRFRFENGTYATIELTQVGIMTKHQYKSDFFGTDNKALAPVMDLIHIQNQAIKEGAKNSATFRFMATASNFSNDQDIANERKRFDEEQLASGGGGIILFKNTYKDVKQVDSKPFVVDANQLKIINEKVYSYFGVNEKILQNSANDEELDAFFNGAVEPFAIQLSDVVTKMLFTLKERANGARVIFSCNRLQYMSVSHKVAMAKDLADRGMITINEIRELFNYPPFEDEIGNKAPIRGEYYFTEDGKENG